MHQRVGLASFAQSTNLIISKFHYVRSHLCKITQPDTVYSTSFTFATRGHKVL
ncbi:hypothetical protein Hanom_Chr09g00861441 [Helianthus anomalus]